MEAIGLSIAVSQLMGLSVGAGKLAKALWTAYQNRDDIPKDIESIHAQFELHEKQISLATLSLNESLKGDSAPPAVVTFINEQFILETFSKVAGQVAEKMDALEAELRAISSIPVMSDLQWIMGKESKMMAFFPYINGVYHALTLMILSVRAKEHRELPRPEHPQLIKFLEREK